MKTLSLSIKQQYFDEIIAGTKKSEWREVRPTNAHKYITVSIGGKQYRMCSKYGASTGLLPMYEAPDGDAEFVPVRYDAIKLITGAYNAPKRPWALVEVKGIEVSILSDKDGDIVYEFDGEEYPAMVVEYRLGKVLERSDY